MRQIVCISTSTYHPFPTRKQNVMNRLEDAEVLYIDPPISLIAPLKDKSLKPRMKAHKAPGEKVRDHITVFSPPPVLPFFNKYRWINNRNQKKLAKWIRKKIKEAGFEKPYLWCYSPTSCDLVDRIPNSGVIYDCVDRHSAYPGMIDPQVVDKMEEDLARKADMVFCTAAGLYDTLVKYNENTVMIPNGAAYELFAKAAEGEKAPETVKGPVFGFVGMLQDCIAYDYLEALAKTYPEGEVRLIGRSLPGVDFSALEKLPNVKFLGLLPQTELPDQIRQFDLCLNLFKENDLSRDVSPLKFYEYLATGKPVVSTRVPLQVADFADVVYIAENKEDFIEKCGQALGEWDDSKKARQMEYGRNCSWDSRVRQMEEILKEKGIFK
ncbi:MAG: glycosyltransferase family 1 protein [Clostridiales bacterium]|nr:glycosyltransferase family 1 protein [Clostridiales bacterium]